MFYTFNRFITCALLLTATCTVSFAQTNPDVTIVNDTIQYDVQTDGRYTVEESAALRIETPQAIQRFGQIPLPYSSTLQQLDVLEAYVVGTDDKRTDVPADRIMVQQTPQSAGAPMFDDGKVKVIIFPGVEVGSVLHLHTLKTQLKPLFPDHFSMVEAIQGIFNVDSEVITLTAPAALKLYVDAIDLKGGVIQGDQADKQYWRWEVKNLKALPLEAGSVAPQDSSPRVAVTTLASDQEAAQAYRDRALPQAAVTPSIQELANEITAGITDRRAQAEAIYGWVSANIRYVAIFLDVGGVVPHAADEIAKARYGDCKDHTTILGALLAAKGIRSSPVLVNADLQFWKPGVAVSPGVFNHAILSVPEFDVYLDSTTQFSPFGTLAMTLRGKPALVVNDKGQAKTVTLPLSLPAQDQVRVTMNLVLEDDGTVSGHADVESEGMFGLIARGLMANIPQGAEAQVVGNVLSKTGQNGSGSFTRGKPRDLGGPHRYSTDFSLPNYVQLPGPGAFIVPQGFSSATNIAATFEQLGLSQRILPVPLQGRRVEETITLQLPATFKPTALPSGVQRKWTHGSYESTVKTEGSTVTITRVLSLAMPGPLLLPQQYAEFQSFGQAVMRDLRAQLVY